MSDLVAVHTSEHSLMEEKVAHRETVAKLDGALERNMVLIMKITAIKKSLWYRIGKIFHIVP